MPHIIVTQEDIERCRPDLSREPARIQGWSYSQAIVGWGISNIAMLLSTILLQWTISPDRRASDALFTIAAFLQLGMLAVFGLCLSGQAFAFCSQVPGVRGRLLAASGMLAGVIAVVVLVAALAFLEK